MIPTRDKFALNPLQYIATEEGWIDGSRVPGLTKQLGDLREAGFTAIQSEVPSGLTVDEYRSKLSEYGVQPGPGYVNLPWSDEASARAKSLEATTRLAAENVALGNPLLFLSMGMEYDAPRVQHPAVGFGMEPAFLSSVRDYLGEAAQAIVKEGGVAALHPHVGSWIETADETRFVLDTVDANLLQFGPDAGHLAWTGVDPAEIIAEYNDRVAGIHIKDFKSSIARDSREKGLDYRSTVRSGLWTEPGSGDLDLDAVFAALPNEFDGWVVVEVDKGTTAAPEESVLLCGKWLDGVLKMTETVAR